MDELPEVPTYTIYADFSSIQRATKLLLDERVPLPEDHYIGGFKTEPFINLIKRYVFKSQNQTGDKSFRIDLFDCEFTADMVIESMELYNPQSVKDIDKDLSADAQLMMDIYKGICNEHSVFFVYKHPQDDSLSLRINVQTEGSVSSNASIAELNRVNNNHF